MYLSSPSWARLRVVHALYQAYRQDSTLSLSMKCALLGVTRSLPCMRDQSVQGSSASTEPSFPAWPAQSTYQIGGRSPQWTPRCGKAARLALESGQSRSFVIQLASYTAWSTQQARRDIKDAGTSLLLLRLRLDFCSGHPCQIANT